MNCKILFSFIILINFSSSFVFGEDELKKSSFLDMKRKMIAEKNEDQAWGDQNNSKHKKHSSKSKKKKEPISSASETSWGSEERKAVKEVEKTEEKVASSPDQKKSKRKKRREANEPLPPSRSAIRETQEVGPIPESPQEQETRLTKNWGGVRTKISEKGIDFAIIYKYEINTNLSGGKNKATAYFGNLDIRTSIDGDKLLGWKGGSAFVYFLADHGSHPSRNIGDYQITSNIEAPANSFKLYEAWLQQLLYEDRLSILAGLHDLNSEFYVTDSSGLFFNSSFGVGKDLSQTGVNGPSIFPTTAPALRIRTEPSKAFYLQWAAFNAQAGILEEPNGTHIRLNSKDGLLLISEMAYVRGKDDSKQLPGKYGIGYWAYTKTFNHQNENISTDPTDKTQTVPVKATSRGVYFLLDQSIYSKLSLFARYGLASTEVNLMKSCLGAGFVFTGLIPTRDRDRFGGAIARIETGQDYKDAQRTAGTPVESNETTLEFNYRFEAIPGFAVQPDFQYVMNPSANPKLENAKVFAVRFEISL